MTLVPKDPDPKAQPAGAHLSRRPRRQVARDTLFAPGGLGSCRLPVTAATEEGGSPTLLWLGLPQRTMSGRALLSPSESLGGSAAAAAVSPRAAGAAVDRGGLKED